MRELSHCAARAIKDICPQIPESKIVEAFDKECGKSWSDRGIFYYELEKVLKILKINFKCLYANGSTRTFSSAIEGKPGKYIIQTPSYSAHILDKSKAEWADRQVYCVWRIDE